MSWLQLASALARAGDDREAAEARETGLRLLPRFSISKYRREAPSDNPVFAAQFEEICAGMRQAGVPEFLESLPAGVRILTDCHRLKKTS